MTLTELRYIIAVARTSHFGRAAEICNVSQPSLSVAVKKLESELNVRIFERNNNEVTVTRIGALIIAQAQTVLENAERIRQCAAQGKDPLNGALRLGVIHSIAPYFLPPLIEKMQLAAPSMPLVISENFTEKLLAQLKSGEIDCAVIALPVSQTGLMLYPLYDETFVAAVPAHHRLGLLDHVSRTDLRKEPLLLPCEGNCIRDSIIDYVRDVKPAETAKSHLEGSSLQTIVYMVAQGLGVALLPASSVPYYESIPMIRIKPLESGTPPKRRVVLVWRKSFPRTAAIETLHEAISQIKLNGCRSLTGLPAVPA